MRVRRIENEWLLLEALQHANSDRLRLVRHPDSFAIEAGGLPALLEAPPDPANPGAAIKHTHSLSIVFPRYYPSMPVEVYLDAPVFHPNIHPDTGFVCLWQEANPRDTAVQALARTQAMAAYRMLNLGGAHQMNREAADWYLAVGKPKALVPLTWDELRVYEVQDGQVVWLEPGRAFSSRSERRLG